MTDEAVATDEGILLESVVEQLNASTVAEPRSSPKKRWKPTKNFHLEDFVGKEITDSKKRKNQNVLKQTKQKKKVNFLGVNYFFHLVGQKFV